MAGDSGDNSVGIDLLGRFRVALGDREVAETKWPARRAAELVQLLALSDGRRMLREQVLDALWPHLPPGAAAANLRKAAHHARAALGDPGSVVLRSGQVALFPERTVRTDVARFESAASGALRSGDAEQCRAAAAHYRGELLPAARYEEWSQQRRNQLRSLFADLLERAGEWERLVEVDATFEPAYRELMLAALESGQRHAALRWYGRLRAALEQELGVRPGFETERVYEQCVAGLRAADRPLMGRDFALAKVRAALDAGADGEVTALVIRGPGGIGKSALCREFARAARSRGWTVAAVRATAAAGPYAALIEAVERVIGLNRALLDALPARTRSVLAELSPLARPAEAWEGVLTRHQVIGAVRRLLLAAAGTSGMVLLVDDAHLADDDTTEALLHLAGVDGRAHPLVAFSYRREQAGDALARGVARLDRAGVLAAVDLTPLPSEDAEALVEAAATATLDRGDVVRIVQLSAGNPFFLIELARQPQTDGRHDTAPGIWEAVTNRFVDLDETARSMLQRLAVAGDELDLAAILALTGLPEHEAYRLLDAALAADVLVVSGSAYRFRHELVRQALRAQVPPHARVAIHREAAQRLAAVGGTPASVAAHWFAGDRPGEAAPWAVAAARNAVRLGAYGDALRHVDLVLRHLPEHADARYLRADALEAIGDEQAPAAYAAAALVANKAQRPEIRAKQALASVRAGDPAAALALLAGPEPTSLEGQLAYALAICGAAAMGVGDPDEALAKAAETRRLAVESGDAAAVVIAAWAEAAAAHAKGELPRSLRAVLRDSRALPDFATSVFDGQLCVAERLLYGNEPYDDVISFADDLEAEAERLGAARGTAFATTFRGEARLLAGSLDAAEADLTHGVELHRSIGALGGEALSLQRLAELALLRGDRARAETLLDEALAVARESSLGFHLFDRIYGTKIAAASDPAAAMAALEEAEEAVHGSMETCPGCRIALAVPAAIAAADAGDLDRAARYEGVASRLTAILMRLPGWYAALDEVRGHRTRAGGDFDGARVHLAAAAEGFRRAGQPLDAQRCERAAAQTA
ncbi:MAG: hypothetical protein JWN47_1786 [Frankiales bacterium]|nr:hypothetical protein [Frankiales bacterium]